MKGYNKYQMTLTLCNTVTNRNPTAVKLKLKKNPKTSVVSSGQILLEPAVIQDVLSAGSHLQLLELLSLCSHYLIQVHTHTHIHTHTQLETYSNKRNQE